MNEEKTDENKNNSVKTNEKKRNNKLSSSAQKLLEKNSLKLQELIEESYKNCIKKSDRDQFRQYTPRMLWGNPCKYFPTTPLSGFQSPQLFEKFHLDTLFFIFYYQPGTYQQHLAAKELKKKSWKYHKKYTTWFLPYDNNVRVVNDKMEQGNYLSFDYESTWSKQLKKDFSFEYIYLEDEIAV
ncbi:CCR4-NOT transcription complex subunit 5, putative [Plasmodium relictum]|uniref:CCR4-NOT transcription complex subunit 5, putative n=1 Tax=Plasmodium relictum TaxID=85471 RepID=A0A1J1H7P3_PLARL|nr:CCR4-NOT transcription complex subunit 5, putative [Plasmodium relictum]CRG99613.1 CCR4-NOT transcription complex subunit 5, putative [Plasmodium relictum]